MSEEKKGNREDWREIKPIGPLRDKRPEATSTGESSEIERRRVYDSLVRTRVLLADLRADRGFWLSLGPTFRERYAKFQDELAVLREGYQK
jgi:hypothetical protein